MSLFRSSLLVGLGSVASRILGFARDILFAHALGAGPVADAFLAAFRLPNLVRRIVGEGGLNPALVPALSRLDPQEADALTRDVAAAFGLALLVVTAVVEIGAGLIAILLAPGLRDDGDTLALVALYTRLSFPIVLCVTLASIGAALLNLRGHLKATALAPLAVNGGLIVALVVLESAFALPLDRKAAWLAGASSLAGLIQLLVIAVALRQDGRRVFALRRPHPSPLLKSLLLAGFPVLAASGAVQLFFLVATQVASFWPSGVSWLYYAERVVQLPLGLMAALGSSLLLPELAARHREGAKDAIVAAQNRALDTALLLALPAATGLCLLSAPMAAILFERGAFGPEDARGTALALQALSLGLPFAVAGKVLSQTLFAAGALRQAVLAAFTGIAVTGAASLLLGGMAGPTGISFAVSLGCLAHAAAIVGFLRRLGLWSFPPGRPLRIVASTLAMGASLAAAQGAFPVNGAAGLAAFCLGGLVVYALAAPLTGAVTRDDWTLLMKKT